MPSFITERPRAGNTPVAAEEASDAPGSPGRTTLLQRLFKVPLLQKLIVTDALINLAAYGVMREARDIDVNEVMLVTLLLTLMLNAVLVFWTLLPLHLLEQVALRVTQGDLLARVPPSPFADRDVARIGQTLNAVLDRVMADQARVQYLSAQAIGAADAERAHLARELHDSTAQSLSAVEMMLSATLQAPHASLDEAFLRERLRTMHEVVAEALQEVRNLSHRVHPHALVNPDLPAALDALVRRSLGQGKVRGSFLPQVRAPVSPLAASVLYRIAQEAVANALKHGHPSVVRIHLEADALTARLVIEDDGRGFDVEAVSSAASGMGLFLMKERLMLVDGTLSIDSLPGQGTVISAVLPNTQSDNAIQGSCS